jgi:hypothetical protein
MNDSSVIISALTSYMHNPKEGLTTALSYYPSLEFKDEEGNLKNEVMNRHFLMYGENIPNNKTKEAMK